jgi:aminomethyltransferase
MVGLTMGGSPVTDYASDFWLVDDPKSGERIGYVTSPWWSPTLQSNIALAFVPWDKSMLGTSFQVELPERYSERSGRPVGAEVVDVPFKPSEHPSARERARGGGRVILE